MQRPNSRVCVADYRAIVVLQCMFTDHILQTSYKVWLSIKKDEIHTNTVATVSDGAHQTYSVFFIIPFLNQPKHHYLSSKLFLFQMECGIPRYAAQRHTVSQVQESEVMNVNETLMQEGTRNSTGKKISLQDYL